MIFQDTNAYKPQYIVKAFYVNLNIKYFQENGCHISQKSYANFVKNIRKNT